MYSNPRWETPVVPERPGHATLFLFHIPGNAGTSIRTAMGQRGGAHIDFIHHTAAKVYQVFESARARQMFAVIRNPRERALKAWAWSKQVTTWEPLYAGRPEASLMPLLFQLQGNDPNPFFEQVDFEALITVNHHFTPQIDYLDGPDVELIPFADLQAGLDRLVDKYGGPRILLPRQSYSASGRPPTTLLSEKAAARIDTFYRADWQLAHAVDPTLTIPLDG